MILMFLLDRLVPTKIKTLEGHKIVKVSFLSLFSNVSFSFIIAYSLVSCVCRCVYSLKTQIASVAWHMGAISDQGETFMWGRYHHLHFFYHLFYDFCF